MTVPATLDKVKLESVWASHIARIELDCEPTSIATKLLVIEDASSNKYLNPSASPSVVYTTEIESWVVH